MRILRLSFPKLNSPRRRSGPDLACLQRKERAELPYRTKSTQKITMTKLTKLGISVLAAFALSQAASAVMIEGSVAFDGSVSLDSPIPTATKFVSFTNAKVSTGTQTGDYVGTVGTTVSMESLDFSPFSVPTDPFWSFSFGGLDYAFTLDSLVTADIEFLGAGLWRLGVAATGVAMITGYDATPGAFSITTTGDASATDLGFGSFTFVPTPPTFVPDASSSLVLLGFGLLVVASGRFIKRKS